MKREAGIRCLTSVLGLCLTLGVETARADVTADQCIAANAKAQSLRRQSKLSAARDQLTLCVNTHCPGMVRDDCARRLDELERLQPTLVFDAKDASGADVTAVKVTIDGRAVADRLDGSALAIDPGPHTFSFEVAGQPTVTRQLVLKEGESGRIEHIVVGARPSPSAPDRITLLPLSGPAATPSDGVRTTTLVALTLGGIGVAGVATGAVFGLMASSAWNDAKAECNAISCPAASRSQAESNKSKSVSDGTVATVAFAAGGALLAGAAVLFFAAPSGRDEKSARADHLVVIPTIGRNVAMISLQGEL